MFVFYSLFILCERCLWWISSFLDVRNHVQDFYIGLNMCKPRNVWISVSHVCIIPPSHRLECVMPVVCTCVSVDSRFQTVSQCVSILTSMSDHEALAKKLCSQHGEAAPSAALYLVWSLISFICSTKVLQEASLHLLCFWWWHLLCAVMLLCIFISAQKNHKVIEVSVWSRINQLQFLFFFF